MVPAKETPDYVISFAAAYGLSQRETGLLRLILDGRTNKEIADELYISDNTVKFHVRNLLHKTGCSNRKELLSLFNSYCSPA
ncbi:MAG: helix-turn-helix transcriptional regulator [Clostridiales bacterium]|nr:helix-turn-helix transcriptional regulator [Clostridiales bacterium]